MWNWKGNPGRGPGYILTLETILQCSRDRENYLVNGIGKIDSLEKWRWTGMY